MDAQAGIEPISAFLQDCLATALGASPNSGGTQLRTPDLAALREIAAAWPSLPPELRTACLAVTRAGRAKEYTSAVDRDAEIVAPLCKASADEPRPEVKERIDRLLTGKPVDYLCPLRRSPASSCAACAQAPTTGLPCSVLWLHRKHSRDRCSRGFQCIRRTADAPVPAFDRG